MMERLKTVKETAEILGVRPARIYTLMERKKLPFVKLGDRQYRFADHAIRTFIDNGGNQDKQNEEVMDYE